MMRSQQQRHESNAMVDLDHMVPGVMQPSERDRARERRRATDEEPGDDSSQRDGPEGYKTSSGMARDLRFRAKP